MIRQGLWPDVPVATSAIPPPVAVPIHRAHKHTHYGRWNAFPVPTYFLPYQIWLDVLPAMKWILLLHFFFLFIFWRAACHRPWKKLDGGGKWTKIRDEHLIIVKGGNVCGQERSEGFSPLVNADTADHSTLLVIFTAHPFPPFRVGTPPPSIKEICCGFASIYPSRVWYTVYFSKRINK